MSQQKLLQVLLVGFPVALAVSVVIALFIYYAEPAGDEGERRGADAVGSAGAKPVSEEGIARTMEVLVNVFGARPSGDKEAVTKTANYLESTLGPRNVGYFLERVSLEENEAAGDGLLIVERGRREPNVIMVLVADYDTSPAGGRPGVVRDSSEVAVAVAVAQALVGTRPDKGFGFFFGTRDWGDADIIDAVKAAGFRVAAPVRLSDAHDFDPALGSTGELDAAALVDLAKETESMLMRSAFRK